MLTPSPAPPAAPVARPVGRASFWWRLLPALTVLALLSRLPSFLRPLWNPDEGYLATQARMLAHGGVLYETVVDRKPPLLPWLYTAVLAVSGDGALTVVRLLAVLAWLLTAAFTAALARHVADDRTAAAAGTLCLLLSLGLNPEDTQAASFEVFMLPATVAAVWCAARGRWTGAGLATAAAFLTKQTGAAVLLPVLWMWWTTTRPRRRTRTCLRLMTAAAAPVVLVALATGPRGFVFWTLTGSGAYLAFSGSAVLLAARALASAGLLTAAGAGLVPAALAALRRRRAASPLNGGRRTWSWLWLWLWLGASLLSVSVGLRFFGHYYLQLVPPLALAGALALRPLAPPARRRALGCCAAVCAVFLTWAVLAPRAELDHAQRLAAAIRARTAPTDRVLVWGMHPETYWFADRTPASRYLTAGLLTNYSGGRQGTRAIGQEHGVRGAWPVLRGELTQRPPALIVDDSRGAPYGLRRTPALSALVGADYRRVADLDGAVLYARR